MAEAIVVRVDHDWPIKIALARSRGSPSLKKPGAQTNFSSKLALDQLESPETPVTPDGGTHTSPMSDIAARVQVLEVTLELAAVSIDDIRKEQAADDCLQPVMKALDDRARPPHGDLRRYPKETRILLSQQDSLVLQDGILYQKFHRPDGSVDFLQIVMPTKLRRLYVERLHADLGHFGRSKTCNAVSRRVYFPGWRSFTGLLVRNCKVCNLHQQVRQPSGPCEFCPMAVQHVDLIGNQRSFQYILPAVDSATGYLWLLPIRHKTAEVVAAVLFDEIISRVSVPSAILTDSGGEFMGEVIGCLYRRLGIAHLKTSAYHCQTDAKCETVHFSVHNLITELVGKKYDRWPHLGTMVLAYNATMHSAVGCSSFSTSVIPRQ